jgi:ubiquinone/menaquinone biosynthesis C-methylase UbiE
VPWLQRKFDFTGKAIIEVGSGTGSSTLALAHMAQVVECYEIHQGSIAVARERLDFFDIKNVCFHTTAFDNNCEFVRTGGKSDAIVFYAVLEHMTHRECLDVLSLAWQILNPGGIIVVLETPNRFSMLDEHTSWLPFFSQLPREIQVRYAARSPREQFRSVIADAATEGSDSALDVMTRWGSGISFHEFELAIGDRIHDSIVLDGYEREMTEFMPISGIDRTLQAIFKEYKVNAHRAFTRRFLYFVAQK